MTADLVIQVADLTSWVMDLLHSVVDLMLEMADLNLKVPNLRSREIRFTLTLEQQTKNTKRPIYAKNVSRFYASALYRRKTHVDLSVPSVTPTRQPD